MYEIYGVSVACWSETTQQLAFMFTFDYTVRFFINTDSSAGK